MKRLPLKFTLIFVFLSSISPVVLSQEPLLVKLEVKSCQIEFDYSEVSDSTIYRMTSLVYAGLKNRHRRRFKKQAPLIRDSLTYSRDPKLMCERISGLSQIKGYTLKKVMFKIDSLMVDSLILFFEYEIEYKSDS